MQRFKKIILLAAAAAAALAWLVFSARWAEPCRYWAGNLWAPVFNLAAAVRDRGRNLAADRAELLADNRRLLAEVGRLRENNRQLALREREHAALLNLVGLQERAAHELIAARVTARAGGGWWQMARLDKGWQDGIVRDLPVISAEGLVGRVVAAAAFSADVLLLVDQHSKISARLSRLDAFGIVRGQGVSLLGDPSCRMDFIVRDANVQPGDEVVTSGLGGVYPPGLLIGYVATIVRDPSGLYQYAELVPAADLRLLDVVLVVRADQPARRPAPAPGSGQEEAP